MSAFKAPAGYDDEHAAPSLEQAGHFAGGGGDAGNLTGEAVKQKNWQPLVL